MTILSSLFQLSIFQSSMVIIVALSVMALVISILKLRRLYRQRSRPSKNLFDAIKRALLLEDFRLAEQAAKDTQVGAVSTLAFQLVNSLHRRKSEMEFSLIAEVEITENRRRLDRPLRVLPLLSLGLLAIGFFMAILHIVVVIRAPASVFQSYAGHQMFTDIVFSFLPGVVSLASSMIVFSVYLLARLMVIDESEDWHKFAGSLKRLAYELRLFHATNAPDSRDEVLKGTDDTLKVLTEKTEMISRIGLIEEATDELTTPELQVKKKI